MVRDVVVGLVVGVAAVWLLLVAALLVARPRDTGVKDALRLLPDLLRLLRDLASDPGQPRAVRVRLALLLGYLALPFDLVPDFLPVIGYADDVIVVVWVLRSVVRRVGVEEVRRHWRGTEAGFEALTRLCRLAPVRSEVA
jgi:uncharacterized membrane protein YkvA (DUF1232 family)